MSFSDRLKAVRDKIESARDKVTSARLKRGATKLQYLKKQRIRAEGLAKQRALIEKENRRINKASGRTADEKKRRSPRRRKTASPFRKQKRARVFVKKTTQRKRKEKAWDMNDTPKWLR